jgi:serpin B
MLVNTLLFEGVWTHQFDADQTRNRPFYRADGTTVEHPMMTQSVTIPFTYHRDAYVAELPYGSGAAYTMLVAVPTTDLDGWIEQLSAEDLATLQAGFREQEVDVLLPRFTLETKQYLKAPLVALGVEQAFQPGVANFTRMSANGEELFIGDVLQNVRLAVDERGTKAAAATVIDMRTTSLGPMLHADRPFLVLIREKQSGVILFAAAVYDPS